MHRNHLIFPLLGLLVVTYAAPDERRKFVRVITEPKPGEEYVSIHTGKPSSGVQAKSLETDSEMDVNIHDEGQTGFKEVTGSVPTEEKIYAHKKLYPSNEEGLKWSKPEKKYASSSTEEIIPDSLPTKSNIKLKNKREDEVPSHSSTKVQEKSNNNKEDDGLYDFVDSPYGSQIVGSASSQASRVNIKKAPNGQEYEYEYVYYYYDEDEEHAKPGSKNGQSTSSPSPTTQQTSPKSNKDIKENHNKSRKPAVVQDENQLVQNTNKGRFSATEHSVTTEESEGHSNLAVNDIAGHNSKTKESGRNLEEALSVPSSSSAAVSEERLPHNPRFPTRSRGSPKTAQEFATTFVPATDTPITRIRPNNGPHQPAGLDLVDSSAFRTHSTNGQHAAATSPRHEINRDAEVQTTPADQVATINNAYNTQLTEAVASVTETVSLDRNQDNTDVDTKGLSLTTTLTPDEVVTVTQRYTAGSTDKGAVDLYAILQQARSEETANTIASSEHSTRFEDAETQFPTTLRLVPTTTIAATTTTTTTTTTTPAPTTTTTTTTAPPARSPGSGPVRSRYRGSVGTRNGGAQATTTTTTEQPAAAEEVTEKRKFKPTRERSTQGSIYSKRYQSSTAALDKESSTPETEVVTKAQKPSFGRQRTRASKPVSSTVPIDENVEVTSAAPKPNFAERSNLRRQNSRNKFTTSASTTTTTTAAPQVAEVEESNVSEQQEVPEPTTAKAVGGRLRPNIRPLRPGLRLNFGGKGSSTTAAPAPSTTVAQIVESSPDEVEEKEPVQETSPTPAPDSLSRLKNKSRFRVPEKQAALAPKQQTLAPPVSGQNRKHLLSNLLPKKKSIQTEEPPVVIEDVKPVIENEQENDQNAELQNEEDADRQQQPSSTTTSTTEAPTSSTNRLSSLLAKRRPLQRRPADLSSRQSNQDE